MAVSLMCDVCKKHYILSKDEVTINHIVFGRKFVYPKSGIDVTPIYNYDICPNCYKNITDTIERLNREAQNGEDETTC